MLPHKVSGGDATAASTTTAPTEGASPTGQSPDGFDAGTAAGSASAAIGGSASADRSSVAAGGAAVGRAAEGPRSPPPASDKEIAKFQKLLARAQACGPQCASIVQRLKDLNPSLAKTYAAAQLRFEAASAAFGVAPSAENGGELKVSAAAFLAQHAVGRVQAFGQTPGNDLLELQLGWFGQ